MNTKLKCLLLDDELPSLKYLKLLCEQIVEVEIIRAFDNPLVFLEEYKQLDFDVLISDIEMPNLSGLQLMDHVQGKAVIFTTAYGEYAADAFDLQAVDYIRKPLKLQRLQQAIQKALLYYSRPLLNKREYMQVNSDKGKFLLYFNLIQFITTSSLDSRDKVVRLSNGTEVTLKNISFQVLEETLPTADFCRINKKEMISVSIVSSFSYNEIKTNLIDVEGNPLHFSLSDTYKTDFLQKISI